MPSSFSVGSDLFHHIGPTSQHILFMAGNGVKLDLFKTELFDSAQTLDAFAAARRQGQNLDDIGSDVRLLGTHEHQMTAVVGEVACISWLILLIDLAIGFELIRLWEMSARREDGAKLLLLD